MKSIKEKFETEINKIARVVDDLPFENRDFFCRWANQQFYIVQNSTRYLALAASMVDVNDSSEFKEWIHHITEETDHDKLLVNDLKKLDYKMNDPVMPETKAVISTQYQDIHMNGPDALLGYALLLEGLSCERCSVLAERVEKALGVKSSYLLLHAKVDQEHFHEGIEKVSSFSMERQSVVEENLMMSSNLYLNLLGGLVQKTGFGSKAA